MWPGNTADVTTVIPVIDRLRRRFDITRVCVVADRGMISAETIAELEARRLLYILGVRERTDKLVRDNPDCCWNGLGKGNFSRENSCKAGFYKCDLSGMALDEGRPARTACLASASLGASRFG
jgi:transposase